MKYLAQIGVLLVLTAGCGSAEKTGSSSAADGKAQAKKVLIVTGMDHPAHKWQQTAPALAKVLGQDPRMAVEVTEQPAFLGTDEVHAYDVVVVHFMNWEQPDPSPKARANLRQFVDGGKGLTVIHFGCGTFQGWSEFENLAGRVWDPNMRGHDPRGPFRVSITDVDHPITRGMESFETDDELYTCLAGQRPVEMLATARSKVDGKDYPMAFVFKYGEGRVFHCALGHDVKAIENASAAELFRRGCAWTAKLTPVPAITAETTE